MPRKAPFRNEYERLYVPGNKKLFPITSPAPPAIIIDVISKVPCAHTDITECNKSPCWKKKYWKAPNITPFEKRIHKVPAEKKIPKTNATKATLILFAVIIKNISTSFEDE